ncbi:MAG: beta-galactosidase, partial [Vulcanimicrobiaceae bacterium]
MARELGFYLVVRPGPVIRNEWRNGGYPSWLLQRADYHMPYHDILEGRYPATATLQNLHSDDAAAQWLANPTHVRYAERWLRKALAQFRPVADRVLAIQLDDDQGAYLTNQTWPAPHLRAYLLWLENIVHQATSDRVPVFINTYQMKVTASSPVWAMGNWYQSDARTIGEHDRAQLAFSTALLGTRPHQPVALSEFQAGWLLAPESVYPRASDPSNTFLALQTALDSGARGVIDFPMQDTLSPPGWSAPFANRFYSWDAAFTVQGTSSARFAPTLAFSRLVAREGELIAATHPVADAAIVWWPSALDPKSLTAQHMTALADATIGAQRSCRSHELSCALVDLRYASDADLLRYHALIVPPLPPGLRALPAAAQRLA